MRMLLFRINLLLLLIFLFTPICLLAQRYYPTGVQSREKMIFGIGTTTFYGDIKGKNALEGLSPNLGLSYEYALLPHLGLRATGNWYRLAASDANDEDPNRRARNLSFRASNLELSLTLAAYLFGQNARLFDERSKLNLYLLAGVGLSSYTPKANYQGTLRDLRSLETEGVRYGKTTLVIPFGAGVQYRISSRFDIALQATYHYSFTDYLDDVSTRYKDPASFNNPLAAALADRRPELDLPPMDAGKVRGNQEVKDSYAMIRLQVHYYLLRYIYRGKEIKKLYQ